jgi:hypothetical protein
LFALAVGWISAARRRAEQELRQALLAISRGIHRQSLDLDDHQKEAIKVTKEAAVGYWAP